MLNKRTKIFWFSSMLSKFLRFLSAIKWRFTHTQAFKNNRTIAVIGGILFVTSALPLTVVAQERIRLATQDWPPFQMVEDGIMKGRVIERLQCALRAIGQPYELHMMRWDKAQLLVETNQFEGVFAASANSARARYAEPSVSVASAPLYWYMYPNVDVDVKSEQAREDLRYGAKFNTSKWLYLAKNGFNVVKKPPDADAVLNMLRSGDIDVALEYEDVFEWAMQKQGVSPQQFRKIPHRTVDLAIHFSKSYLGQHPSFLKRFNAALTQCRENES